MTEKEALQILTSRMVDAGVLTGAAQIAKQLGIKPTTVYGWWRRESIPEWRLPAFATLAEQSGSKRKARKA